MSSRFLNERLNLLGKVGSAMCVLGSTVVVLHSPKEQEVESIEDLLEKETPVKQLSRLPGIRSLAVLSNVLFYSRQSAILYDEASVA